MSGDPVDNLVRTNLASPGCFLLLIPVGISGTAFGVFVVALIVGAIQALPDGDRVRLVFEGCEEASEPLRDRIDEMGLGAVDWRGPLEVDVTLPSERDVAASIPEVLARRGLIAIWGDDEVLIPSEELRGVTQEFTPNGDPVLGVYLTRVGRLRLEGWMVEHPEGVMTVRLDDEVILERPTRPVLLEQRLYVASAARWERDRYIDIAEWYVTGLSPLPCDVEVRATVLQASREGGDSS